LSAKGSRTVAALFGLLLLCVFYPFATAADAAAKRLCINNDCPVKSAGIAYGGGALITAPNVYLLRFSNSATKLAPASGFLPQDFATSGQNLSGAINAVISNPATSWWQHAYSEPGYQLGFGSYVKTITVTDPALATAASVTTNELTNEMDVALSNGALPDITPNAVYDVVLRSSQKLDGGFCYTWAQAQAYNSANNVVDIPYFTISNNRPQNCQFAPNLTPFESETSYLSGLLMDSVLDPGYIFPGAAGWVNISTGTELTDVCRSGRAPTAPTTYQGQKYYLARLWSIQARACLVTPLVPKLTASFESATDITASISVQGHAEPGQSVIATSAGTVIASGVTNSAGRVSLTITPLPSNTSVVVSLNEGPEYARRVVSLNSPTTSVTTTTLLSP